MVPVAVEPGAPDAHGGQFLVADAAAFARHRDRLGGEHGGLRPVSWRDRGSEVVLYGSEVVLQSGEVGSEVGD